MNKIKIGFLSEDLGTPTMFENIINSNSIDIEIFNRENFVNRKSRLVLLIADTSYWNQSYGSIVENINFYRNNLKYFNNIKYIFFVSHLLDEVKRRIEIEKILEDKRIRFFDGGQIKKIENFIKKIMK